MLRRAPRHADAHFLLGIAAAAAGRFTGGLEAIERAVALAPDRADYHAQRARCLAMLTRNRGARDAAERALALGPRDALTFDTVGVVLARIGAHERAADAFRRAVALAPERADFHYNLGASLRFLGDFAGAMAELERAVEIDPRFYKAYSVLAELRAAEPDRERAGRDRVECQRVDRPSVERPSVDRHCVDRRWVDRLRALLAGVGDDVDGELHLRHALATELESLGEHDAAFEELEAGKRRKRASVRYDFEADRTVFERLEAVCDEAFLVNAGPGCVDPAPIFVVGMPRTGTTLVERMLAGHSEVASVGELPSFGLAVKQGAGTASPKALDPATVSAAARIDFAALGSAYIKSARDVCGDAARFVDKTPLNFFYAGFIAAALPNAKIVCVRRNPLDTCVGSYRRLFATRFGYYYYALDLADVGRYYIAFDRLVRHWRRLLGTRFYEIEYEALTAEPRNEMRRLLSHLELEWEDGCLEFHLRASPVATASAVQVREPLHGRYVGRWRRYAGRLGGLIEQLRSAGIELGEHGRDEARP